MLNSRMKHFKIAKHVLRYLKNMMKIDLIYEKNSTKHKTQFDNMKFIEYRNNNYAKNLNTR